MSSSMKCIHKIYAFGGYIKYTVVSEVAQLCPTLQPHGQLPALSSSVHGIFKARRRVGCHFLLQVLCNKTEKKCNGTIAKL